MASKRIAWIDNLRGLCMVFVCFHHTGTSPVWFHKFYLPIFLTSFFFVSGYLFHNPSRNFSPKQKLLNIFTSLVIPYFIYCSCCSGIALVTHGVEDFLHQLYLSVYGTKSWFISALILCQLFCLVHFQARPERRQGALGLTLLLAIMLYFCLPVGNYFWNFRNALLAYFFFGCGMFARRYDLVKLLLKHNNWGWGFVLSYVLCVAVDTRYNLLSGCFNAWFTSYPFFFLDNVVGIPAIIYLCSRITSYNRLLLFIGANSLLYYYLPTLVNIVTDRVLVATSIPIVNFPMLILVVWFKCLLMIIPVWFINKYLPVFAGKYRIQLKQNEVVNR